MPPKQHDSLFPEIASFSALHAAAKRAIKGKRRKPTPAAFVAGLDGLESAVQIETEGPDLHPLPAHGFLSDRLALPRSRRNPPLEALARGRPSGSGSGPRLSPQKS
jgi:hypothetical protein